MAHLCFLQTGQKTCHDSAGIEIPCQGSGQDAEFATGIAWPEPRFEVQRELVCDRLTGLFWTRDANPGDVPLDWQEALDFVDGMNRDQAHGFSDWRLPERIELRSLISYQTRNPALPGGHPFNNVFPGWYWTSATAARNADYAWYVHLEGGRVFYGGKRQFFLVWPVRGEGNGVLCHHKEDGRFQVGEGWVLDRRTNLRWSQPADPPGEGFLWGEALAAVREMKVPTGGGRRHWRLPNINELESLVDLEQHDPALPPGHPFAGVRDVYWSSTTSMYEPDWAWALYLDKGAVGVGRKADARFNVWAVCDGE